MVNFGNLKLKALQWAKVRNNLQMMVSTKSTKMHHIVGFTCHQKNHLKQQLFTWAENGMGGYLSSGEL